MAKKTRTKAKSKTAVTKGAAKSKTGASKGAAKSKTGASRGAAKSKTGASKGTAKSAAGASKGAAKSGTRVKWLDDKSGAPLIERYARELTTFMEAVADGEVQDSEVQEQEARVVKLMKEIEPRLDEALHAKVTHLLCELTAYDLMQVLNSMRKARPKVVFRG